MLIGKNLQILKDRTMDTVDDCDSYNNYPLPFTQILVQDSTYISLLWIEA
jgi:hypothetical protein